MTNGDKIRRMRDEELVEFIDIYSVEDVCRRRCAKTGVERYSCTSYGEGCKRGILQWLKQEVCEDAGSFDINSLYPSQMVKPTIKPEVRHGRWEILYENSPTVYCSECGAASHRKLAKGFKGCPYCLCVIDALEVVEDAGAY